MRSHPQIPAAWIRGILNSIGYRLSHRKEGDIGVFVQWDTHRHVEMQFTGSYGVEGARTGLRQALIPDHDIDLMLEGGPKI
jgi:hypothetical protein